MPHLRIETNVPAAKVSATLLTELGGFVAKIMDKPAEYCMVTIVPDQLMSFAGTTEPCGIANLLSIGHLGTTENIALSKALFEKIEKELGIPSSRMYITYQDEIAANIGHKGTTFHEIFGQQ